jgi:hypothetical protein
VAPGIFRTATPTNARAVSCGGPILVAFTILIVYLLGARLVWEGVDNRALDQLRRYPSIELNC